jgi:hypothetical protein
MQTIKIGNEVFEDFTVTDSYHTPVTGLNIGNFDLKIYNGSGINNTSLVNANLQELGNGNYRLKFTPDSKGIWGIILKNPLYFPYGKGAGVNVIDYDIQDVGDMLKRILGLTQENYYVYDTEFDNDDNMTSSKIRIYSDGNSIGTTNNILAEYNVTATYIDGNLETYSVKKV